MSLVQSVAESQALQILTTFPHKRSLKDLPTLHKKIPFCKLDATEKKIEERYEISPSKFFFKVCDLQGKQELLILIVKKVDAVKCLKFIATNTSKGLIYGAAAGGIVGGCISLHSKNPMDVVKGAEYGAALLGGTALVRSSYSVIREFVRMAAITIPESLQLKNWKNGLSKEKYDLFIHLAKNYGLVQSEKDYEVDDCPISNEVPNDPVISPNGHVYEKRAIVDWLSRKWAAIQRGRDSGYSEEALKPLFATVCPLRGRAFQYEDLRSVEKIFSADGALIAFRDHIIPSIPVKAPDGLIHEKEIIERCLDERWVSIEAFKQKGCTAEELKRKEVEVFGGEPFKKEDLVYDIAYSKKMIDKINEIKLKLRIVSQEDKFLQEILDAILGTYKNTYKEVKKILIVQLQRDLLDAGATQEQYDSIVKDYKEYCKKPIA